MRITSNLKKQWKKRPVGGFTTIQLVITVSVVAIVSAFAAYGIRTARASMRLASDTRQLASYLEKARADSVRRNARAGFESSVQIVDRNTYTVTMGFGGSDTLTSQTFRLSEGVIFGTDPLTIKFDWRGRPTAGGELAISLQHFAVKEIGQIDVTGAGDVTVGSEIFQDDAIPDINLNTNVSGSGDVAWDPDSNINSAPTPTPTPDPDATPDPNATPTPDPEKDPTPTPEPTPTPKPHGTVPPTPTPTPEPTPTPTPEPDPNVCSPLVSPPSVSIHKNGGSETIAVKVSMARSGTVSASTSAANLKITPASQTLTEGGSVRITILSQDNTRGDFTVTITTPCGTYDLKVSVTN